MTKQIPYDLIPASDLPRSTPGAFDSVVGVDESTGAARRFPMPVTGAPKAYETRADLPASASEGTAAYVNNDPTAENNGLWAFLDGAWVKSADRFTTMEGRLSTAELDVSGLKDFRIEADARLDNAAHDILDLRDRVPDDAVGYVWGVADEDGKLLAGLREDGKLDARLADPFRGHEAPAERSIAAIADEDGRELVSWDRDGTMRAKLPDDAAPRRYPYQDADDSVVYGVTDSDGRLLLGVTRGGELIAGSSPQQRAGISYVADVEAGDVYLTGPEGRTLAAHGRDWPFRAAHGEAAGFRASQARPLLGADRLVRGSRDGVIAPDSTNLLTHYIGFGQSLSMGSNGYPLVMTNEYPGMVLMYQGLDVRAGLPALGEKVLLDPDTLTGFEPLAPAGDGPLRGQTHLESIGPAIAKAVRGMAPDHRMLFSTFGWGGTPYAELKKGTDPYQNILLAVTRTKLLAAERGLHYWVPAICFQHGEGDAGNPLYFDHLQELMGDLNLDIPHITGQQAPVQIYMGQVSSFQNYSDINTSRAVYAIYRAAKELDGYTIVCPQYTMTYAPDLLHMDGPGYHTLGEYYAKALLAEQYGTTRWRPLMPASVNLNGSAIDIEFHVPVEPLVMDTNAVSDPGNYGFDYYDTTDSATIVSVSITGPRTVRVQLSNAPTGGSKRIKYAMTGYGAVREPGQGPRGCLRDSDSTPGQYGPLHNWCLHFEEEIE